MAIKLVGGLYLLWLTVGYARLACRTDDRLDADTGAVPSRHRLAVLSWLFLNLLKRKAVVARMTAFAVRLGPDDGLTPLGLATVGCIVPGYAAAVSIGAVRSARVRLRRWIDGVFAALFAVAGLAILRAAFDIGTTHEKRRPDPERRFQIS